MAKAVASINMADGAEANSDAKKVATNYLASDSTGIMVAELSGGAQTPSTATGNNVRITSTTVDVRKGQNTLTSMGQSGMQVYNGSGTRIANLGYGAGTSEQGTTVNAPYYDLGERLTGSTIGNYSVAEGSGITASGWVSHAEGVNSRATGTGSHAEGYDTRATNAYAHAEGHDTVASGDASHAEGRDTTASGSWAHAEGRGTKAIGNRSHAQGAYTEISEDDGTVLGRYNSTTSGYAVIIGGGNGSGGLYPKKDIVLIDWSGNVTTAGDVTANGATLSGALQKSGGTMTGQLLTSYRTSVAMGSYGSAQSTVGGLAEEVRYSSGCMGSASITQTYTKNGVTIATGWYNYIYSPHRSGGINGSASGDNCNYGTLILSSMTSGSDVYVIRISTGSIQQVSKMARANRTAFDGNGSTVTGFWNSDITTHQDGYLERRGDVVYAYLRFSAPATVVSGQGICTIPTGYRPTHVCHYTATRAWAIQATAPVSVGTGGAVAFINTAFNASANYVLCQTWFTDDAFPA